MSGETRDNTRDYYPNSYRCLFHPGSIAVVGASNSKVKPGGRVMKSILENGYGGKLWAVNPKAADIMGQQVFPSINDLPGSPDLAIVAIPSPFVVSAIKDLAEKNTGAVIILTAGFGEKDEAGKRMEAEMLRIAAEARMVLVGPNCSGFLTTSYKGKFAGIIPSRAGGLIDIISGSGATVDYLMERGETRGLSFGNVVNLGNSIQLGVEDLVQMYDENYGPANARILMLYMESIKKPAKLLLHARSLVEKGCFVVGIKSGSTAAGERAAASHTGAMATSDTAVEALFAKAGILRVKSRIDLINTACALSIAGGPLKGNRVCVVTDAGGPGVMLSDELNRQGMVLPGLRESTRARLAEILPAESSTANPIDALPSRNAQQIQGILQTLGEMEKDNLDAIAVLLGDSGMSDNSGIYQVVAEEMESGPVPVFPMFSSVITSRGKIAHFICGGRVVFPDEVSLGETLGRLFHWQKPAGGEREIAGYDKRDISRALEGRSGVLSPGAVTQVLRGAGFLLPMQMEIGDREELTAGCRQVQYPLVMKVIGPLHKTDLGGVKLGIASDEGAAEAWDELMAIPDARGVLLQPMIQGSEVILGASREGDFGHLVMFGLGGIYAEVLKDVRFALAPLDEAESLHMIRSIRAYPVLEGVRGESGMDIMVLADNLQRLGRLVADFPEIAEIDINPLKGSGTGLYAVDARIIVA
jgi:acyl-CoA synthetase (NDP forming)